jgi:hypothetical protein
LPYPISDLEANEASLYYAFPNHRAFASSDYPFLIRIVILVNPVASVPKIAYHDFYSFDITYLETPFVSCDLSPKVSAFLSS